MKPHINTMFNILVFTFLHNNFIAERLLFILSNGFNLRSSFERADSVYLFWITNRGIDLGWAQTEEALGLFLLGLIPRPPPTFWTKFENSRNEDIHTAKQFSLY